MPDWAVTGVFKANASGFIGALSKMKAGLMSAVPGAQALSKAFHSIAGQVAIGNIVSRGIEGIGEILKSVPAFAENAEQIGRTASMIGTTAENLQRLQYAAKMTDTPVESLQMAFRKLNLAVGQGERGLGPLIKQMSKLNPQLAMQLRRTHDSSTAFNLVAKAIRGTTNVQMRAAMAVAAFGKAGQELIPMFIDERYSLAELTAQFDQYGAKIDDKAIAAAKRFMDANKRLTMQIQAVKNVILTNLVTALAPYVEKITAWIMANRELIAQKITDFIKGMGDALRSAWPYIKIIIGGVGWLVRNWPLLAYVYLAWTAAQIALDAALDANPIGAIVLALEALALAVFTVIKYWTQITTAIRTAWTWFDRIYNKSLLLRNAIFFLAGPIWLVVEAVRTLIDLLSGRGWKSFQNFIPPWLKGATDKLGLSQGGGGMWGNGEAAPPNAAAMQAKGDRWNGHIWVHAEAGTGARVGDTSRGAPPITGPQGLQYAAGTP